MHCVDLGMLQSDCQKGRFEMIENLTSRAPERDLEDAEVCLSIEAGRGHEAHQSIAAQSQADIGEKNVAGDGERVIDTFQTAVTLRHPVAEAAAVNFQEAVAEVREHRIDIHAAAERIEAGEHLDD